MTKGKTRDTFSWESDGSEENWAGLWMQQGVGWRPLFTSKTFQAARWPGSFWKASQSRDSMWRASEARQEMSQSIWEESVWESLPWHGQVHSGAGQCNQSPQLWGHYSNDCVMPQRQYLQPSPYLWLLHSFLLLLLKCSLSIRVGRLKSSIELESLPAIASYGPEGAHETRPSWAINLLAADRYWRRNHHLSSVVCQVVTEGLQWIVLNPWPHRWPWLKSAGTK